MISPELENQYRELDHAKHEGYDYENQAWVVNGLYEPCGHPEGMDCQCYGKLHAGEPATGTVRCTTCGDEIQ